jgi:PAS domain S-box-containing protein
MEPAGKPWRFPRHLVLIFFFLSVGVLILGYGYYGHQAAHFQREMEVKLNAIANLQVQQIIFWHKERMHDALSLFDDPIFAREVQNWFDKGSPLQKEEIINRLQGLKFEIFEGIRLLDSQGTVRLAIPENEAEVTPLMKGYISNAVSRHKIIFVDLHFSPKNEIRLDLIVPIHYHKGGKIINVGVVLMMVDPQEFLYTLIQSWPTPSPTAEFVLFRREENEVVYLNELRHRSGTALALRTPLNKIIRRSRVILGKDEITHEIDYRGVPVLAATRAIPGSPWFLTAKIDLSEVTAPLRERFQLLAVLLIALIGTSGAGIAYFWRNRDVQFYRQQYEAERVQRYLAQRYEYLAKNANDIILIMDQDLKILEANDRAIVSYGYPREEYFSLHLWDINPQSPRSFGKTCNSEKEAENGQTFEQIHRRKDGTTFPVTVGSTILEIGDKKVCQQIIRDITKSKEKEKALQESEEQLRFLSSRLLIAQEEERNRISKELHDELGQALVVTKYQISSIASRLSIDNNQLKTDCKYLLDYLEETIEKVRRLSWDLSPSTLEQFGLFPALKNLLEEFGKYIDIQWEPEAIAEIDGLFPPLAERNIYRIFQESLTNIARHAEASRVCISIAFQPGHIDFHVEDNGKGFDLQRLDEPAQPGSGIGLSSMKERARLLGGSLKILSCPGAGTKISFSIPIDRGWVNDALSHSAG